ncbi:sulfatase-like hydrolase/transferase, partial [Helicobacter salomonis]|uniref:sulfatase-like hydrolase/transferase n=1 Tax=Helicobacter salomonis TaxID=56878 RepID=UPI001315471D
MFNDAIAPFAYTLPVFQTLLNYSNAENHTNPWYQQKNLGDIFKMAGYKTFWLDNQERPSFTNAYTLLSHRFATQVWTNASWTTYDQTLLDAFRTKIKSQLGDQNFILFHLIGSHLLYNRRFPKSFAKFTPA